jgi:hypothetical protein
MGKKLSKEGAQGGESPHSATEGEHSSLHTCAYCHSEDGPVEDVPIGNEFSHVNNRPLTIEDFELLKVI